MSTMREAKAMGLFTGDVEFQEEKLLDVKFDFTCFWSNRRPFSRLLFYLDFLSRLLRCLFVFLESVDEEIANAFSLKNKPE